MYDGSLLQRSTTDLTSLEGDLSFTITIINNQDTKFICDITLPIKLQNDNSSINDGYFINEITNSNSYIFYKTN